MQSIVIAALAALATIASLPAYAHPGGLNAKGCHNNRKTGDFHCHRARQSTPASSPPGAQPARQTQMPSPAAQASAPGQNSFTTPSGQTCFVGPRGGTYTITKSGRKNYSGC